jgi:hypothetical protein
VTLPRQAKSGNICGKLGRQLNEIAHKKLIRDDLAKIGQAVKEANIKID